MVLPYNPCCYRLTIELGFIGIIISTLNLPFGIIIIDLLNLRNRPINIYLITCKLIMNIVTKIQLR